MIRRAALWFALASGGIAWAGPDDQGDADRAFRAAEQHAAAGDPHALDELEALGSARPTTRWTDDAWSEAARLAERAGDYERARRDLEQVIATTTDDQLARRARNAIARIASAVGANGQWSAVAAEHDRLEAAIGVGDPRPALAQLQALVERSPAYPRVVAAMLAIAGGWERDGEAGRALAWLRRAEAAAGPTERGHVTAELARTLIRQRELDDARAAIDRIADPKLAADLRRLLARAVWRERVRWSAWAMLAAIALAAVFALRRAAGAWRVALRRVVRPPAEVIYFGPIAAVLVAIAWGGNPMVARAVRAIGLAGVVVAWLSGAILDAVRARGGRVPFARAAVHAALALVAIVGAVYLAIDRDRMIDLVIETWRNGPQMR